MYYKLCMLLTIVIAASYVNAGKEGYLKIYNKSGIPVKLYGAGIKGGNFVRIDDGKDVTYTHGYGQANAGELSGILIKPLLEQAVDQNKEGITIENDYNSPGNMHDWTIEMTRLGGGTSSDLIRAGQAKTFKPNSEQVNWTIRGNIIEALAPLKI